MRFENVSRVKYEVEITLIALSIIVVVLAAGRTDKGPCPTRHLVPAARQDGPSLSHRQRPDKLTTNPLTRHYNHRSQGLGCR